MPLSKGKTEAIFFTKADQDRQFFRKSNVIIDNDRGEENHGVDNKDEEIGERKYLEVNLREDIDVQGKCQLLGVCLDESLIMDVHVKKLLKYAITDYVK
jgi:hypothetical protein